MHCGRFINCGLTRRDLLLRSGAGFGSLAAAALFREPAFGARIADTTAEPGPEAGPSSANPLAPKPCAFSGEGA